MGHLHIQPQLSIVASGEAYGIAEFTVAKLHIEFDETSMMQMAIRALQDGGQCAVSGTYPVMAAGFSFNPTLLFYYKYLIVAFKSPLASRN